MEKTKEKEVKQAPKTEENPFLEQPAEQKAPQTYEVRVDGESLRLTLEQLIEAAESGLNRRSEAVHLEHAAQNVPAGQVYAAFVQEYPDIGPDEIPEQVWTDARREGSLVAAYRKWEILQLKSQLAALEKNAENRRQAVGGAAGDGDPAGFDPVAEALLA